MRMTRTGSFGKPVTSEFAVSRDQDEVTIICSTGDGLPYAYMRGGLFVAPDRLRPGGLVVRTEGAPTFLLRADQEQHHFNFGLAYVTRQVKPYLLTDVASLLRGALDKMQDAWVDAEADAVHVKTEHSAVTVFFGREADALRVAGYMLTGEGGATTVHLAQMGPGPAPWPTRLSERALFAAGLPLRRAAGENEEASDVLVPPDLAEDPALRRAAQNLHKLLLQSADGRAPDEGARRPQRPPMQRMVPGRRPVIPRA